MLLLFLKRTQIQVGCHDYSSYTHCKSIHRFMGYSLFGIRTVIPLRGQ
jgi:hypothetical protein